VAVGEHRPDLFVAETGRRDSQLATPTYIYMHLRSIDVRTNYHNLTYTPQGSFIPEPARHDAAPHGAVRTAARFSVSETLQQRQLIRPNSLRI